MVVVVVVAALVAVAVVLLVAKLVYWSTLSRDSHVFEPAGRCWGATEASIAHVREEAYARQRFFAIFSS